MTPGRPRLGHYLAHFLEARRARPVPKAARLLRRSGFPRISPGVTAGCRDAKTLDEMRPADRVLRRFGRQEVAQSDWPIHFMRWITRVEPTGASTRITQSLEYKVKFGPVGWVLDNLVMKRKLTSTLDEVFASLVKHAEGRE
jgi:hypothetical protein